MIDIVNAADAAYAPHTGAMLHSLFASNPGERFRVHFLHRPGFDPALTTRLAALCHAHGADFSATTVDSDRLNGLPIAGRFPQEAWYRVVLPQLLPRLSRVLWLDSDVIVRYPVRELWNLDLGDAPLAACPNAVMFNFRDVIANLGIEDRHRYFNSGVMVLDLARMRAEDSESALRGAASRASRSIMFADQDVLNIVYHRHYHRLRLAWNVLSQSFINVPETLRVHGRAEFVEAMAHPRILHFTGTAYRYKPWFYACSHPYREEYLRHRAAAGWPPPVWPDRSVRTFLVRRLPLRLREVLSTLRRGRYDEMMSYLRPW